MGCGLASTQRSPDTLGKWENSFPSIVDWLFWENSLPRAASPHRFEPFGYPGRVDLIYSHVFAYWASNIHSTFRWAAGLLHHMSEKLSPTMSPRRHIRLYVLIWVKVTTRISTSKYLSLCIVFVLPNNHHVKVHWQDNEWPHWFLLVGRDCYLSWECRLIVISKSDRLSLGLISSFLKWT